MIRLLRKLVCGCECNCPKTHISGFDKYGRSKKVVADTKANFKPEALPPNPPKSNRSISSIKAESIGSIL